MRVIIDARTFLTKGSQQSNIRNTGFFHFIYWRSRGQILPIKKLKIRKKWYFGIIYKQIRKQFKISSHHLDFV